MSAHLWQLSCESAACWPKAETGPWHPYRGILLPRAVLSHLAHWHYFAGRNLFPLVARPYINSKWFCHTFFFCGGWVCMSCGIWDLSFPWPGIKPMSPAMEVWRPNNWTTRKVPIIHFYSYIHSQNIYWAPTICQALSLGSRNIAQDETDENPALVELEDQPTK